jgi:GNAT superfamily N-acetyltransferase
VLFESGGSLSARLIAFLAKTTCAPSRHKCEHLGSPIWIRGYCVKGGTAAIGCLVMIRCEIDALFIAPEWIGLGGGSLLVRHARSLHGRLTVDVNEQNEAGLAFYLARGFSIASRSDTDGQGRPFPCYTWRSLCRLAKRSRLASKEPAEATR